MDEDGNLTAPPHCKTPAQGTAASVLLAASRLLDAVTGRYFENNQEAQVVPADAQGSGVAAHAPGPRSGGQTLGRTTSPLPQAPHPRAGRRSHRVHLRATSDKRRGPRRTRHARGARFGRPPSLVIVTCITGEYGQTRANLGGLRMKQLRSLTPHGSRSPPPPPCTPSTGADPGSRLRSPPGTGRPRRQSHRVQFSSMQARYESAWSWTRLRERHMSRPPHNQTNNRARQECVPGPRIWHQAVLRPSRRPQRSTWREFGPSGAHQSVSEAV
jgi:hypothetical protein